MAKKKIVTIFLDVEAREREREGGEREEVISDTHCLFLEYLIGVIKYRFYAKTLQGPSP